MSHSQSRGRAGEERAASWLCANGYEIIARNFRSSTGEVDIIGVHAGTIVAVEVKSWGAFGEGDLERAIDRRKRERIIRTVRFFLDQNPLLRGHRVRFDVIFVPPESDGLHHIEGAFDSPWPE